jgi:hypothetical protein
MTFNGGTPSQVASFSPGVANISAGGTQVVKFQVQDANGNPVPSTAFNIVTDQQNNNPFWITAVNGATVTTSLKMGTGATSLSSVATPIPLGNEAVNYAVNDLGVAPWSNATNTNTITVYSDASGNVSLTLQAGGMSYPDTTAGDYVPVGLSASDGSTSGTIGFYANGSGAAVPMYVYTMPTSQSVLNGTLLYNGVATFPAGTGTWQLGSYTLTNSEVKKHSDLRVKQL